MAIPYAQFQGNGTTRLFPVSFPFIQRSHVKVYLDYDIATGIGTELVDGAGFAWSSDSQIIVTVAPGSDRKLTIIRRTPSSGQLVVWSPGSPPTPTELNQADLQTLYLIQELAHGLGIASLDAKNALTVAIGAANAVKALEVTGSSNTGNYTAASYAAIAANPSTPAGTIVWLQQPATSPPAEYLYANGIDKTRSQYNVLFNAVGATYGPGDGTTTFGIPLEANLSNPLGDSSYKPFIKYGSRTSGPGQVLLKVGGGTFLTGWIADGTTVKHSLTSTGGTGLSTVASNGGGASGPSITADGLLATVGSSNASGQNVFVWKKNGLSYDLVSTSPALVAGVPVTSTALSPDGNYLAVVSSSSLTTFWIYKANSARSEYTLLAAHTFATPFTANGPTHINWSDSGDYLALSSGRNLRIFSRSGDTFNLLSGPTAISGVAAGSNILQVAFSPDMNNIAVLATWSLAFSPFHYLQVYSRAGSAYSFLAGSNFENDFTTGSSDACKWSPDGASIFVGGNGIYMRIFNFSQNTLTPFVLGFATANFVFSKSTANQFYNLNDGKLYSWNSSNVASLVGPTTGSVVTGNCATGMLTD